MRKTLKSALSVVLSAAMVLTSGIGINMKSALAKADSLQWTGSISMEAEYKGEAVPIKTDEGSTITLTGNQYNNLAAEMKVDLSAFDDPMITVTATANEGMTDPRAFAVCDTNWKAIVGINNDFSKGEEGLPSTQTTITGKLDKSISDYVITAQGRTITKVVISDGEAEAPADPTAAPSDATDAPSAEPIETPNTAESVTAKLYYASQDWACQAENTVIVTKDGEYSIECTKNDEAAQLLYGGVFVVDLEGIQEKVSDFAAIKASNVKVEADGTEVVVDQSKLGFGDLEEKGKNYRIEIYNQYGPTKENSPVDQTATWTKSLKVTFTVEGIAWGTPAPTETPSEAPTAAPEDPTTPPENSYNAYLGFQTDNWYYRNEQEMDLNSTSYNYLTQICNPDTGAMDADIKNVSIAENGSYSVSISGVDLSSASKFNLLFITTDIPVSMKDVKFTDVKVYLDDKEVHTFATGTHKSDNTKCYQIMAVNAYDPVAEFEYSMPKNSMRIDFTVSGIDFGQDYSTKTYGAKKGTTFTSGNFKYKITTASKITAGKITAGKVQVVGLSAAGKKKTSVSVGTSIKHKANGQNASYTINAVAEGAFKGASKLKAVTLSKNIKSIKKNTFQNCAKLSKLTLKAKLGSVAKDSFKGCKKTITVKGTSKAANVKLLKKKNSSVKFK